LIEGALLADQPVFISIAAVAEILAGMRPSEEEELTKLNQMEAHIGREGQLKLDIRGRSQNCNLS